MVRFVFVCCRCVSVEVDGIVVVGRRLFVVESLYGRPEFVSVTSVVPVSVEVFSPEVFTVFLYVRVNLSVYVL